MNERTKANVRRYRAYLNRTYGRGAMDHLDIEPYGDDMGWQDCHTTDAKSHRCLSRIRWENPPQPAKESR